MKNIIKILLLVSILLVGCSNTKTEQNNNTNIELPDVWGDELNNVSFAICHDDEIKNYSYQFMSRIEIPENSSIEAVYSGGSFDYEYSIEKTGDSIGDFYRYIIKLTIQNVQFEKDEINVDSIRVVYDYDNEKYFDLIPDEFSFRRFEGDIEQEVWYFNNAPLIIPASGNYIHYDIGVEKGFVLNEIIVTNDSFKIKNITEYMNVPISTINATDGWELQFSVEETDRSKYTQYTTSVVFKYTVNGKEYIKDTVGDSVYNPFALYDNLFEMYYNEVLTKEQ